MGHCQCLWRSSPRRVACDFLLLAIAGWFLGRWPAKGWAASVAALLVLCVVALSVVSKVYTERVAPGLDSSKVLSLQLTPEELSKIQRESGSNWLPWSAERVNGYLSQGRPVFVDFTASWCLSCQVNERIALGKPEVQKAFADANVVLMRADWTRYDDNITRTLNSFGRSGVPTYALYVPGETQPRLLPEVLTPGIVTNAIAPLTHGSTQTAASPSN